MALTDLPTKWPTRKVVAGGIGAGAGDVVSDFLIWAISAVFLHGQPLAAPPERLIEFLTPVVLAVVLAYFTPRGAEELAPPQRPGQHVRRQDETGGAALPPEPPTALVLAVVVVIVVLAVVLLDGALRT